MLWSLPDAISGLLGQPGVPGLVPTDNADAIKALDTVSAVGGGVLALALAAFVALLVRSAPQPATCPGDDPWAGHTLEWATSSPPPVGNFASLPAITSEAPLYDARHQPQEADA